MRSRFDGTEETVMDKALKLAGKNPVAQGILNKVIFCAGPSNDNMYMIMLDELGLYSSRIELLFISCGKNLANFLDTVSTLYFKRECQDKIIAMKTQEEFDILVKECQ